MRADGTLSTAAGLAEDTHVCWVYDDPGCFTAAGRQYLADGLARGNRLFCVGERAVEAARDGVGGVAFDELFASGALRTMQVDEAYATLAPLVPEQQLEFYDTTTREALTDGFTGLRVLAEVTDLVRDPAGRAALVCWEHLADDYMATGPGLSALCAYDQAAVGDEAAAELESVHPLVRARDGGTPFRVFFDGRRLAIAGVVDAFGADRLSRTLDGSHVRDPQVTIDLGRLEFVDVRGCTVVARYAHRLARDARELRLVGAPPMFQRVWHVLGYDALRNTTMTGAPA